MQRKVLVLGGTRYFGKHLIQLLRDNGDDITIVTRGNNPAPKYCRTILFDRNCPNNPLALKGYWDVVYDQSCYCSDSLKNLENIIQNCDRYILTSSQAVYPFGLLLKETCIDYEDLPNDLLPSKSANPYGLEKVMSERFIAESGGNYVFPRFPTVIGSSDPLNRIQKLIEIILSGKIELPSSNPTFNIVGEYDAANALYELGFLSVEGPINIASLESLSAKSLISFFASRLNINIALEWKKHYSFIFSDIIKNKSKTLCLDKQKSLPVHLSSANTILDEFLSLPIKKAL